MSGTFSETEMPNDISSRNYFLLEPSGSTGRWEIRCKEVFFASDGPTSAGFSMIAGLTGIPRSEFPVITASNGFAGVG